MIILVKLANSLKQFLSGSIFETACQFFLLGLIYIEKFK